MNKTTIAVIVIVLLLLGGGAYFMMGNTANVEAQSTPLPVVEQPNTVSAEAFIVPLQEANLSFQTNGQVVSVEAQEGDAVTKGQVLAKLDDTGQQAGLAQAVANLNNNEANLVKAQASLAQAEASLANLKAGATPEQIAQVEADLEKAEVALAALMAKPRPEDVAQAQASVETARANLAQVLSGSRQEDIDSAAAGLLKTESQVRLAQADYDKFVYGEPQMAEPFGVALQQATLDYDAAKAAYNKVVAGPTAEEIAVSRAHLYEAEVALQKTLAGASQEDIAQAQADIKRLQAKLAETKAGAAAEEIAQSEAGVEVSQADIQIAQANVESAQANLASAQADLSKTQMAAPYDGVIGSVSVSPGEYVQAGASNIVIGDTSRWQVETDDLTELARVKVRNGADVTIRVDALPGETFTGQVVRITPKSEEKSGDVTYTVLIDITQGDTSALEWGMTAYVDIQVGPEL